ncbi:hypothetical protein BSR29_03560 [Boudabousia liubingyangii]|uniref:Uncharacterized protein n=1 Tax=Boudabousia liubingyangii TaxID=1921764 RepID=A0A1Q5PNA9_9ACTO|nr:hypothetical protein [Boudabousia liubingyangii]OKL48930.1 hypothetical protein BSR29_03560 [Boudabousia liubingyangii]
MKTTRKIMLTGSLFLLTVSSMLLAPIANAHEPSPSRMTKYSWVEIEKHFGPQECAAQVNRCNQKAADGYYIKKFRCRYTNTIFGNWAVDAYMLYQPNEGLAKISSTYRNAKPTWAVPSIKVCE